MYTLNDTESELSVAYLQAVAAKVRVSCTGVTRTMDNEAIDATLHGVGAFGGPMTEITLHVQLKATVAPLTLQGGKFSYFLKGVEGYNKLRSKTSNIPKILVVLQLPSDQTKWLEHSVDQLILRNCAYWVCLAGAVDSTNATGQTIYIPQDQVLSPDGLRQIFARLSNEEELVYAG